MAHVLRYKIYALSDDGEVSDCLGTIYDNDLVFEEYWRMFQDHRILLIPDND